MNPNDNDSQNPNIINPNPGQPQPQVTQPVVMGAPAPAQATTLQTPQFTPTPGQPVQPPAPQTSIDPFQAKPNTSMPSNGMPFQPSVGGHGNNRSSSKIPLIAGGIVVLVLLIGGVIGVMSARDKDTVRKSNSADTYDQAMEEEESLAETDEETAAKPQESTVDLNKVAGGDLGKTITITKMIQNFPHKQTETNEETLLLEIKAETDGSYSGTPGVSDFRLVVNGEEYRPDYSVTDAVLAERGLAPYATQRAEVGKPAIGYAGFTIPRDSGKVTFRYLRGEARILGGQTYAAKAFDVVIRE